MTYFVIMITYGLEVICIRKLCIYIYIIYTRKHCIYMQVI